MKNYDDILKELEKAYKDCPEMPESLSKENVVKKIKEEDIKQKPKRKGFRTGLIAAAVAVVLVIGVAARAGFLSPGVNKEPSTQKTEDISAAALPETVTEETDAENRKPPLVEGVCNFDSKEKVEEYFLKIYRDTGSLDNYYLYGYNSVLDGVPVTAAPAAASGAVAEESTVKDAASFGTTNIQTAGVDEGDIIKNDGRYLYFASGTYEYEQRLKIFDTQSMSVVYSGIIGKKAKDTDSSIHEIYVNGNIMTVIYTQSRLEKEDEREYYISDCSVEVYDIQNRTAPKKINTLVQDGSFVSSRMIGDILYTVSTYHVFGDDEDSIRRSCIPAVDGNDVACDQIYFFDEGATAYTVVTALDTSSADGKESSIAILGDANEVYCSTDTLYYFSHNYEQDTEKTEIVSFCLDKTDVRLKAKGEVKGRYNSNYSFDEYKGFLRCATTSYDIRSYKDVSSLYVLNDKLEIVGSCENISDNEQVKSVRFMGDKGYVVTFRNTDPLFAMDLSDPENPRITGELKLPGYSTYLHPLSQELLMGIGYDGDEESADMSSLKVALFDISDMTSPCLLDEYVIKNAGSEANYDPKALVHFREKELVGIPVESYNDSFFGGYRQYRSFAVIGYSDNKLSGISGFLHDVQDGYSSLFRGTYIGDRLYTVDSMKVVEHNLENGKKLRECVVVSDSEKRTESENVYVTKYGGVIDLF